jgi:hypothetical protein
MVLLPIEICGIEWGVYLTREILKHIVSFLSKDSM